MTTRRSSAIAFVLTLALAPASFAEPRVRLAYFPNLTHAPALVGVARGTFAQAVGTDAALDVKTFSAGPALIEALFAGEVDVGYVGPSPAVNGFVKSRGEALRIVAGASSGGALFVVRAESGIAKPADLAGKKLATPQLGGTQDVALRHYLKEHGLESADKGGTVEITPTQPADIFTLFTQRQIDGAWLAEPWASRIVLEGGGKVFVDERTQWPDRKFSTTVVVARKAFLDAHPDVVRAILRAHEASVRFLQDDPAEAKRIIDAEIQRITSKGIPRPVLDAAFANTEFTSDPLPATIQKAADQAFALGFLGTTKPDLSDLYALDLLRQAQLARKASAVAQQ